MGYDMTLVQSTGDHDKDYFRLNMWGMKLTREAMEWRGHGAMLDCDSEYPFRHGDPAATMPEGWREHRGDGPGITWWKLCSNDEWVVTPEECREAVLAYWEGGPDPDDPDWFLDWLRYIERAIDHGGFVVS